MSEQPEFDRYASEYEKMLADPIRDGFVANPDFFHRRKWILIEDFFRRRGQNTSALRWLDVGCGKGDLLRFGQSHFAGVAGCDPSAGMMASVSGVPVSRQEDPLRLPYADASFDFATAVCVYHHVEPADRAALTAEVVRVLRPQGIFAIIEHNPFNPATQLIVSRTPVDADAKLLRASAATSLLRGSGLQTLSADYFLYFPEKLYASLAAVENVFRRVPLGGQYAVFAQKN